MIDHRLALENAARHLLALLQDLVAVPADTDWDEPVAATRSIGPNMTCRRWHLAYRYLERRAYCWQMARRFAKQYGRLPDTEPLRQLNAIATPAEDERQIEFDDGFFETLEIQFRDVGEDPFDPDDPDEWVCRLRDVQDRLDLCRVIPIQWAQRLMEPAQRDGEHLAAAWSDEIPREVRREVWARLDALRHARLWYSWLDEDLESQTGMIHDILSERTRMPLDIEQILEFVDGDEQNVLVPVLHRLDVMLEEMGFDGLVDLLQDGDFTLGPDGPIGAGAINLIPSPHTTDCKPLLVAVAAGSMSDPRKGVRKRLREISAHLVRCSPNLSGVIPPSACTRTVVLLTCAWDAKSFKSEHAAVFEAHRSKGVAFIVLQVASDGRSMSWIEKQLAR